MEFDLQTECLFQHGFETLAVELAAEKGEKTIEKLLKKYKENLSIGNNTNLVVTNNNQSVPLTSEAKAGNYYLIHINHDKKGYKSN